VANNTTGASGEGRCTPADIGKGEDDENNDHDSRKMKDETGIPIDSQTNNKSTESKIGRVIAIEKIDPKWKSYLEAEHNLFLNEIKQLNSEASKSLDICLVGRAGCGQCDTRLRIATTIPIHHNLKLKHHITFVQKTPFTPAHFEYDRIWTGSFEHLPSGEPEARKRCERLLQKLNRSGNACAREGSYRLQSLFSKGKVVWASPYDLAQRHTFLPIIAVLKTGSSSAVRICSAPTTLYHTPFGQVSYNQCIAPLPLTQPKLLKFQLMHLLASQTFTGDISQMFNSIHLNYKSSLHFLTYSYRTHDGWPTYCSADSVDGKLHVNRNIAIGFGTREAPSVSKFCLTQASTVYKQANIQTLTAEENLVCQFVKEVLGSETFADDLLGAITLERLSSWCETTGKVIPNPPSQTQCILSDTCVNPDTCWSEADLRQYRETIDKESELLLIKLATMLIKILNHSSFELKYLKGSTRTQQHLDRLIASQVMDCPKSKLQVTRPNQTELNNHISNFAPQCVNPTGPATREPEAGVVEHLGHLYFTNNKVELKSKSLSIIYTLNKRQRRSIDFYKFEQFLEFYNTVKPTFTKRSIFSILAKNCCTSGNYLVLFKSQIKITIRLFIRKNRKASWDHPLDDETVHKMLISIETYFFLVGKSTVQPLCFKYQTNELFLLGLADGSENLFTYSLTLLGRSCIGGTVSTRAIHLSLQSYSVHCDLLNIVDVEYHGFQRLLQSMSVVIDELGCLGINIAATNRLAFSDSRVLLTLLRSRVDLLKKRQAHLTAKVQLQLADLKMSPFQSIGYISQLQGNHHPDTFSKFSFHNNLTEINEKYEKLMNHEWMCSAHPRKLPGISFDTAYPSKSETPSLKAAVLESEWQNFEDACKENNPEVLMSAATHLREMSDTACCTTDMVHSSGSSDSSDSSDFVSHHSVGCEGNDQIEAEVKENKDLLWSETDLIEDSENSQTKCETSNQNNPCDTRPVRQSEKANNGNNNQKDSCDTMPVGQSEKEHKGHLISSLANRLNTRSNPGIYVADGRERWREQIDHLLERKRSYGLGAGSALRILSCCMEFGSRCKKESKKAPEGRRQRQKARELIRAEMNSQKNSNQEPNASLIDRHDWPRPAVDLMKCSFGEYDDYLKQSKLPEKTTRSEEERKVFHQLCSLYNSSEPVKGMRQIIYNNQDDSEMTILEARRQRDYSEKIIRIPRLRPVIAESQFAATLLSQLYYKGSNKTARPAEGGERDRCETRTQ